MDERGRVSLTRLMLLWTASIALSAVSLGGNVFLLPVALLVSVGACIALLCARNDVRVWWGYAAVIGVASLSVALIPFLVYLRPQSQMVWMPALLTAYVALAISAALVGWRNQWTYGAFWGTHCVLVLLSLEYVAVVADVQSLMDGGAAALLDGNNPYAITVPGVYDSENDWFYGPGVLVDGRIMYGYPYLPLPLLVVLPAYALGDVRLALAMAMVVTSLIVRRLATDQLGRLASVLILVMPVSWLMQVSYWVEPVLLLAVAMAAMSMVRGRSRTTMWFGCFLASKQFAIIHLPYLWILAREHGRRGVLVALAVPAVLCLLFLLWDPGAFWHSAVDFHLRQPYRHDTVTLTPAMERLIGSSPDFLFGPYGLVIGSAVSALISWRCRPSGAALAAGVGLSLAIAVLFSKQGHTNYWGLIGGALLIAVATWSERPRQNTHRWHTPAGGQVDSIAAAGR